MEEQQSVKGLRDYFQGIIIDMKQQNDDYQKTKNQKHSTSVQPQRESVNRESLKVNLQQQFNQQQQPKTKEDKLLQIIHQQQEKIKYLEEQQINSDYSKLQNLFDDQKQQLITLQEMNDKVNEELIQANNTIYNLENQLHSKIQQNQDLMQIPSEKQSNISEKLSQKEFRDQEVQVDLITPAIEQNKLLLERLHENPQPMGKELIIINSSQAIELRRQMEALKQELVLRLNHYNNLIQSKQLQQIKKSIKSDITHFYDTYLQMFKNINRPIQDVEQIGKILSPIYQDDLNEFLSSLEDFFEKFRLVSIL